MTRVRVYLPAVLADLGQLVTAGALQPRAGGRAVTPALRDQEPGLSMDEWEFLAFTDAADASLALLQPGDLGARRVVVSADLDPLTVQPKEGAAVAVIGDVSRAAVAAVHVDGPDAVEQVTRVLEGEASASLDDLALEWYDPSEIDQLVC